MAENIVIYAGLDKVGKMKKRALELEALRETKSGSVSEMVWNMLRTHGSVKLKKAIARAERRK